MLSLLSVPGFRDGCRNLRRRRPTAEARELLVNPVFLIDVGLSLPQQRRRLLRTRQRERLIAQFVVSVVFERDGWPWRIQTERFLADLPHRRVVAEQGPVAAVRCQILLLHAVPQV